MIQDGDAIWMLRQLEQLAERLGIEVRYERLGGNDDELVLTSGACRLKGRDLIIIDDTLNTEGRCQVLAGELRRFDLSKVFVTPAIRALITE